MRWPAITSISFAYQLPSFPFFSLALPAPPHNDRLILKQFAHRTASPADLCYYSPDSLPPSSAARRVRAAQVRAPRLRPILPAVPWAYVTPYPLKLARPPTPPCDTRSARVSDIACPSLPIEGLPSPHLPPSTLNLTCFTPRLPAHLRSDPDDLSPHRRLGNPQQWTARVRLGPSQAARPDWTMSASPTH
jgi:hypothetical protein